MLPVWKKQTPAPSGRPDPLLLHCTLWGVPARKDSNQTVKIADCLWPPQRSKGTSWALRSKATRKSKASLNIASRQIHAVRQGCGMHSRCRASCKLTPSACNIYSVAIEVDHIPDGWWKKYCTTCKSLDGRRAGGSKTILSVSPKPPFSMLVAKPRKLDIAFT